MFKTLALVSALTSVALAQSNSTTSTTASPLIPSGISSSCTAFFTSLNADSSIASCFTALNTATSAFAPGTNGSVTSATVTSALGSLCADSVANVCPENVIRSKLSEFSMACTAELTTQKVDSVKAFYETLYIILPMRSSICAKDDSGSYCVQATSSGAAKESSSVDVASLLATLYSSNGGALKRRAAQSGILPNITTFHDNNLPFLYYNANQDASALCTTCARQVITTYMNFESNSMFTPGLPNGNLLSSQAPLLDAIKSKCPAGFLNGAVQAAGGLSAGVLSGAAATTASSEHKTVIALAIGIATFAGSYIL